MTFVLVTLLNGEEIGWRGFGLPRMTERWGWSIGVLTLGSLEAFHLPIFFNNGASDAGGQNATPFLAFVASSMLAVVVLAWVFDNTRGSLLLACLCHGSMNTWSNVLPFPASSANFFWCMAAVQLVVCAVVCAAALGAGRWRRRAPGVEACHGLQ